MQTSQGQCLNVNIVVRHGFSSGSVAPRPDSIGPKPQQFKPNFKTFAAATPTPKGLSVKLGKRIDEAELRGVTSRASQRAHSGGKF